MAATTPSRTVSASGGAERHTGGPGVDVSPGLQGLPEVPDPAAVGAAEARALSKTLFVRLDALEEGTPEYSYVRNTLVELNLALVRYAVSRVAPRTESYEDVVQVGTIGLIKAINRFDPSRGIEFPTFAMPTIIGEIKRFFRDTTWAVRVPRGLQELTLDLRKATTALEQLHGHAPTVAQLAAHLGKNEDEVIEALVAYNGYSAASLDYAADPDDGDDTLAAHLGYDDEAFESVENLVALKPLIARLPERERTILTLRFTAGMTQAQIGERLGVSQMHISRLLNRTLSRLRAQLTTCR